MTGLWEMIFQFSAKMFFIRLVVYKACLGDSSITDRSLWKPSESGSFPASCFTPHRSFQEPQAPSKMVAGTEITSVEASAIRKDLMLCVEMCPSKIHMLKS